MALGKEARLGSGLPLNYHRIQELAIEVNVMTGVYVRSYLSREERELELAGGNVYSEVCYFNSDGPDGPKTVEDAYQWLKATRPEFADAEDC